MQNISLVQKVILKLENWHHSPHSLRCNSYLSPESQSAWGLVSSLCMIFIYVIVCPLHQLLHHRHCVLFLCGDVSTTVAFPFSSLNSNWPLQTAGSGLHGGHIVWLLLRCGPASLWYVELAGGGNAGEHGPLCRSPRRFDIRQHASSPCKQIT